MRRSTLQLWERLLATGHWYGDIWDRRKDGSIYPKYLSISVVRDEAGNATHYSGIFYDISERKTVEGSASTGSPTTMC